MISGVYKIVSIIKPDRCYIGSSQDIYKRWDQHLAELRRNKHHSSKLQRHYNKYGKNDLQFSILIGCDKEDLISTEQYFIDIYMPYFNGRLKACNNGGFQHTEDAKRKISEFQKGNKNPNNGIKRSPETCRKISEARKGMPSPMKGKIMSEETRRKISEAHKGRNMSPKTQFKKGHTETLEIKEKRIAKIKGRIPWNKGKPYPHKGHVPSEETLQKMSNAQMGRKHSPETKKKMSEWRKDYYMKKRLLSININ